jgi:hypothetical protein
MSAATKFQIRNYDHGGVLLSLSGYRDDEECVIERVTAADSQIDLFDLFQPTELGHMAARADAQLDREADEHNADVPVELHQWHNEFRVAA